MNILLVNWRCMKNPEAGGAEVHFHEIFKRIAAMGHTVTLVSHHYPDAAREEVVDGIRVIRVGNKFLFAQQFKRYYLKRHDGCGLQQFSSQTMVCYRTIESALSD